jgi:tetratricopeptide (TPR) repeat protein
MVIQWRRARFWCGVALFVMLASSSSAQTGAKPDDLSSLLGQARQLYEAGKYAEAVPLAQRAVELAEKQFGPEHPNVVTSLNNLAELYREQGRYAEAEPLQKRALAIGEKTLGPEHPRVAISLNNIALIYQAQGRYAEAEPLLQRA